MLPTELTLNVTKIFHTLPSKYEIEPIAFRILIEKPCFGAHMKLCCQRILKKFYFLTSCH